MTRTTGSASGTPHDEQVDVEDVYRDFAGTRAEYEVLLAQYEDVAVNVRDTDERQSLFGDLARRRDIAFDTLVDLACKLDDLARRGVLPDAWQADPPPDRDRDRDIDDDIDDGGVVVGVGVPDGRATVTASIPTAHIPTTPAPSPAGETTASPAGGPDAGRYYLRSLPEDGLADFPVLTSSTGETLGNAETGTTVAELLSIARARWDLPPDAVDERVGRCRLGALDSELVWMPPQGEHVTVAPTPRGTTLTALHGMTTRHHDSLSTPPDRTEERP